MSLKAIGHGRAAMAAATKEDAVLMLTNQLSLAMDKLEAEKRRHKNTRELYLWQQRRALELTWKLQELEK